MRDDIIRHYYANNPLALGRVQKSLTLSEEEWDIIEMALEIAILRSNERGSRGSVSLFNTVLQKVLTRENENERGSLGT